GCPGTATRLESTHGPHEWTLLRLQVPTLKISNHQRTLGLPPTPSPSEEASRPPTFRKVRFLRWDKVKDWLAVHRTSRPQPTRKRTKKKTKIPSRPFLPGRKNAPRAAFLASTARPRTRKPKSARLPLSIHPA